MLWVQLAVAALRFVYTVTLKRPWIVVATTWPVTIQSNSILIAARCCFTVGFSKSQCTEGARRK